MAMVQRQEYRKDTSGLSVQSELMHLLNIPYNNNYVNKSQNEVQRTAGSHAR